MYRFIERELTGCPDRPTRNATFLNAGEMLVGAKGEKDRYQKVDEKRGTVGLTDCPHLVKRKDREVIEVTSLG